MNAPIFQISRRLRRHQGGFSLVELMVAAAIMAIAVSGFYLTFGGANQLASRARLNTSAKIILASAINETLGSRWSSNHAPLCSVVTTGTPYSPKNEGQNASPVPRAHGKVSLFTSPNEEVVVEGDLIMISEVYVEPGGRERSDMRRVTFRLTYSYNGVAAPPLEMSTVITRE